MKCIFTFFSLSYWKVGSNLFCVQSTSKLQRKMSSVPSNNSVDKFSLRWNNFQKNLSQSFSLLRSEEEFFDVSLVSDDKKTVSAHKVVLSACSPYFKQILKGNNHSHPLLCMEGISSTELSYVLDYMYQGEVLIGQEELERFVTVAGRLQLEGLVATQEELDKENMPLVKSSAPKKPVITNPATRRKSDIGKQKKIKPETGFQNYTIEKNILLPDDATQNFTSFMNVSNFDQKINENFFMNQDSSFTCTICGMTKKRLSDMQTHVELHLLHQQPLLPCQSCGNTFKTRSLLSKHLCPVAVAKFT